MSSDYTVCQNSAENACCYLPHTETTRSRCTTLCQCPISTQLLIQKQRRTCASLFTMNLGAVTVTGPKTNAHQCSNNSNRVNWCQSSDRLNPSKATRYVPTRGNRTRSSITRHRPGSLAPGGIGVDIKHNSYARYLARKKSHNLQTEIKAQTDPSPCGAWRCNETTDDGCPKKGNKVKKYGLLGFMGFNSCATSYNNFCKN
jgi:hypothetical protein